MTKYVHKKLYHQTSINPTKIKKVKTVPGYKYKLMRPSIDILNPAKIFTSCFDHEICLKAFSMQKIFMASAEAVLYYVLSSLKSC